MLCMLNHRLFSADGRETTFRVLLAAASALPSPRQPPRTTFLIFRLCLKSRNLASSVYVVGFGDFLVARKRVFVMGHKT